MSLRLRHLTTLENLPRATIERLLDRAVSMRDACAHGTRKLDLLAGRTILNLFFEPSTRTRTSFELAARRLGADVINFDIGFSSTSKGEELYDTLHTLEAMHLDAIVVRHKTSGTPDELVRHAMSGVSVINAGDGKNQEPRDETQPLLGAELRHHLPDPGFQGQFVLQHALEVIRMKYELPLETRVRQMMAKFRTQEWLRSVVPR